MRITTDDHLLLSYYLLGFHGLELSTLLSIKFGCILFSSLHSFSVRKNHYDLITLEGDGIIRSGRPHRITASPPDSQSGGRGSIPRGAARNKHHIQTAGSGEYPRFFL